MDSRLQLLADLLALMAHTLNYAYVVVRRIRLSSVESIIVSLSPPPYFQEYEPTESDDIAVYARELGGNVPRSAIFNGNIPVRGGTRQRKNSNSKLSEPSSIVTPGASTCTPVNEKKPMEVDSDAHTSSASATGGDPDDTLMMEADAMTSSVAPEETSSNIRSYDCFDAMEEGQQAIESTADLTYASLGDFPPVDMLKEIAVNLNTGNECSPETDDCNSSTVSSGHGNESKLGRDDIFAQQNMLNPHDIVYHGKINYDSRFPFKQVRYPCTAYVR